MRKLLVWDLDKTLIRGVFLEGTDVELLPGRAALIQELAGRGVLQAVASRNQLNDVRAVLHQFGLDQYFLVIKADFVTPKSEMVKQIMSELGLARTTDLVFVDDEPSNRAEVAGLLDGVVALDPDGADLEEQLLVVLFSKGSYTQEDHNRVLSYRAELERQRQAASYVGSYKEFLESCDLFMEVSVPEQEDMVRVLDLIRRTNQLSAVAAKFSDEELGAARKRMYVVRVWDRFGDYGLSGVLWLEQAEIKLLVISCRLQGKGIGSAFLGWLINRNLGSELSAQFVSTPYNEQMRSLYQWYSFKDYGLSGVLWYRKKCSAEVELPSWITIIERV